MTPSFFTTRDGIRLAYREAGIGLPVLALAGLTRDSRDFNYLLEHQPPCRLICLDSRGRGASAWASPETYTVAQEADDALQLLDYLGLDQVAVLGTSRGGLIGMLLASIAHERLLGLCLNDVGPVLQREGLMRIAGYVGVRPNAATLSELADRLPKLSPGFTGVPKARWAEEVQNHFTQEPGHVGLNYDPALSLNFKKLGESPLADVWPLFDACVGLPLALIRGRNSDILSALTAEEMLRRRPDMLYADVPNRGHVPFLDEPEALRVIVDWSEVIADGAGLK